MLLSISRGWEESPPPRHEADAGRPHRLGPLDLTVISHPPNSPAHRAPGQWPPTGWTRHGPPNPAPPALSASSWPESLVPSPAAHGPPGALRLLPPGAGSIMVPRGFRCERRAPCWSSGSLGLPWGRATPLGTPISPLRTVLTSAIVVICSLTQQHVFFLLLLTFKALKGQVCRAHFHGSLSILNIEEI